MGRIGIVRLFERITRGLAKGSEVTFDMGGGENSRSVHFTAVGDDTQPLVGDYAVLVDGPGTGRELVVAYADPKNTPVAGPGEKRIYSRNASSGNVAAEIWMKADGTTVIENANGSIELGVSGIVTINGVVTISATGDIVTTGSITAASVVAAGKALEGHVHLSPAPSPGNTGPNL